MSEKGASIKDFYLVNFLRRVDCIDLSKTGCRPDKKRPGEIEIKLGGYVFLDRTRIPPDAKAFSLEKYPSWIVVREDFIHVLRQAGFGNLVFSDALLRYSD